jgi:glycosyl hydrolase family 20
MVDLILLPPPIKMVTNNSTEPIDKFNQNLKILSNSQGLKGYWGDYREILKKQAQLNLQETQITAIEELNSAAEQFSWIILASEVDINEKVKDLSKLLTDTINSFNSNQEKEDPEARYKGLIMSEGYELNCNSNGVCIVAPNDHGCFNGLQTLLQISRLNHLNGKINSEIEIFDYPKLGIRGYHLDLKDLMPTFDYVKELLYILAEYKTNYVCIEYEDKYPYTDYLGSIPHKYAWSKEQFEEIRTLCKMLFIEIMPLIQIFGHTETFLKKDDFKHLQETHDGKPIEMELYKTWSLCPLHPESPKFATEFVDQIVAGHPDSKYVHIAADEVYQLGTCPKCKEYLKTHTKSELYINHINIAANRVLEHNKIPVMWHDYLLHYPENLDKLNKKIVIMYWIYGSWRKGKRSISKSVPPETDKILPYYEFFEKQGFEVMGAPSMSSDFDLLLPNYLTRLDNVAGQSIRAHESKSLGLVNTSWVVCANPIDTQLVGLALSGALMWAPEKQWDNLPWDEYNKGIQSHFLGIKDEMIEPWLESFVKASEKSRHIYPTKISYEILPEAIISIFKLQSIAKFNVRVLKGMQMGLEFRKYAGDLLKQFREAADLLRNFAETEEKKAEFLSMEYLEEFKDELESQIKKYDGFIDSAIKFYIDETKQLLPGELNTLKIWPRYQIQDWLKEMPKKLEIMFNSIDEFLLSIFRNEMEFLI